VPVSVFWGSSITLGIVFFFLIKNIIPVHYLKEMSSSSNFIFYNLVKVQFEIILQLNIITFYLMLCHLLVFLIRRALEMFITRQCVEEFRFNEIEFSTLGT
jgi:hypothetical protein